MFDCRATEADNQLVVLEEVDRTSAGQPLYLVVHLATRLCLDVAGVRDTRNDLPVLLNPCDADEDHLWAVV